MASQKISQLTPITILASGDYFPVVQVSGTSNKRVDVGVLDVRYAASASGDVAHEALASGNAALIDLTGKYDKSGGLISGAVTTESRAIGLPDYLGAASGIISLDFSASNNFEFTLISSGHLANPVSPSGGQAGAIVIRQTIDGSGILSYDSYWKFSDQTAPELTVASSGLDIISYYCVSPVEIAAAAVTNLL